MVDFLTSSAQPVEQFPKALNYYLPESITVSGAKQMPLDFHSRKDATSRIYRYQILNRDWKSPIRRNTHYWVRGGLQVSRMAVAARRLVGTHDFRALAAGQPPDKSAIRRVYSWEVWKEGDTIIIEAEANGFLRHQIRKANALLIGVGKGHRPETIISDVLSGKLSAQWECSPLPAHGLCLMEVNYPPTLSPTIGPSSYEVTSPGRELSPRQETVTVDESRA